MLIGICSDIHGLLSTEAYQALSGCDYILCAGDVERPVVLMELETIAPVIAVRGNCDALELGGPKLNESFNLGGVQFFMTHRPEDIRTPPEGTQVVVHGHTHIPRNEVIDGIRYLNPGSTRKPRGGSSKSIIKLVAEGGQIAGLKFVEL